ncbi:hypothetical protein ALUC_80656A [Aspergillus luchuensis]|nr:hypothetical protein ALUC_80656A [Aspergillus luchuensis]
MLNEQEPISEADSTVCPDITNLADGTTYDEVEELLLLHLADQNDPLPPELEATTVSEEERQMPSRQVSPLLMERPKSSGIDMTAFCFQRPTQGPNLFSLQPAKRSSLNTMPPGADAHLDGGKGVSFATRKALGKESSSYPANSHTSTRNVNVNPRNGSLEPQVPEDTSLETTQGKVHAGHDLHDLHAAASSVPQVGQRSSADSGAIPPEDAALNVPLLWDTEK